MYLKLLGTAAGGGFPQWNCACRNCAGVRSGLVRAHPRTQSQAAVSTDARSWFLLNASPDLRTQIERTPALQPQPGSGLRSTPIAGVVLTAADLDHVLGLLLLREFQPIRLFATPAVRSIVEGNSFFRMLERVPGQSRWVDILPGVPFDLAAEGGPPIRCTPIPLPGAYPQYVREALLPEQAVVGLLLEADGTRTAYLPSLPAVSDELRALLDSCDLVLVDGTFWSDDELRRAQPGTPPARSIGHLPLGGHGGTLALLDGLHAPLRVLTHINNTNPILDEDSPEHAEVRARGWTVGHDRWEIRLAARPPRAQAQTP